jgi:hypothetical protein
LRSFAFVHTIVPNHSAFRKRNRSGNVTSALRLFEVALVFVRFDHVASGIVNADDSNRVIAFDIPALAESVLTNCGRLGYAKEEHERATVVP